MTIKENFLDWKNLNVALSRRNRPQGRNHVIFLGDTKPMCVIYVNWPHNPDIVCVKVSENIDESKVGN